MAEIKIEKKKPVWPWIAVLLVIGAIIYYIYFVDHQVQNDSNVEIENTTTAQ